MVATTLAIALPLSVVPAAMTATAEAAASSQLTWSTVVNVADLAPGSVKTFNSFNQPSVNADGLVVFRARTKGESEPVRGVYTRDMAGGSGIATVAAVGGLVPAPNNSDGTFNEFPAFPRIDATGPMVATRGQSTPVLTYTLPDGTDTKVGTSGVYATPGGVLTSGATLLGSIPEYSQYAVPDAPAGTRFDQFPGAPAVDGSTIVFKGNYTVGTTGLTGVYFRDLSSPDQPVKLIAGATTRIPNQAQDGSALFGSTAPASAADGKTVFSGWDNEATPTMGGIYLAPTEASPPLTTIVGLGDPVPGQGPDARFTNVGEGLSFDGRYLGFWASWGSETRTIVLTCPTDGNKDLVAFCLQQHPNGYTTTVPAHQGIFVADTSTTPATIHPVTATGPRFDGFQYWVFSGRPPGTGGGDEVTLEPARWRSSAFVAVSSSDLPSGEYQVAFKATPVAGGSGIYLGQGPSSQERIITVLDTATLGTAIDPMAPAASGVTTLGVERDAFRGRFLAVNASMLDPATTEAWAGIYLARVPANLAVQQQAIAITSQPVDPMAGGSYVITAMADSGLPVSFSVDATTTNQSCSVTGASVRFDHAGTCVLNADQPGDAAYTAAVRVQQSFVVTTAPTTATLAFSAATTTYGQEPTATATITAPVGTPAGDVQFAVDSTPLGSPVSVSGGTAVSPALLDPAGHPLAAGTHTVTATFTPTDASVFAASTGSGTLVVAPAATTTTLGVTSSALTATVSTVAPGVGPVSGVVEFTVGGVKVGEAALVSGVATLNYVVPAGQTQTVAASYAGDLNFTGSSTSLSRFDPTITARVTSAYPRSRSGWYRSAVTVTFTCTTNGAPLAAPCPAPVRLAGSGGAQSVTRTIVATDGGVATVVVAPISIDLGRPVVRVAGVRNGGVYFGQAPAARCVAADSLSGVASCVITRRTSGERTTYRVTAYDRAGNAATATGSYTVLRYYVQGARYLNGVFQLRAGQRYTIVAYATTRPTYYYAAVYPRVPTARAHTLYAAGYHRWVIGVTPSYGMRGWASWNIGVKVGATMQLIRVHVS